MSEVRPAEEPPIEDIPADEGDDGEEEYADAQVGAIVRNLSPDEIDMLRDAFIHMDRDSDGFVGLEEMMSVVLTCVGPERYAPLREYLEPIFRVADKDRDGKLSLTEFLTSFADGPGVVPADVINHCVATIRVRLSDEEIATLQESFRKIDKNEDGYIDREELTVALKEILLAKFPDLTDHTFGEIVTVVLASADSDNDGKLSLSEFIRSFQEDQGVLPAAFIDVRAQHVARQLTQEEIMVLKEAFAALDKNNDGFVDFVEMYQALWEALESSIQDKSQVRELCDLIMVTADRDEKGKLTLTDFIRNFVQNLDLMKIPVAAAQDRIVKASKRLQEMFDTGVLEKLVTVFTDLDQNHDGFLDHEELQGILNKIVSDVFPDWSEETKTSAIDAIISAADTDKDGRLSLEEFVRSFVEGTGVLPETVVENWESPSREGEDPSAAAATAAAPSQPQQAAQPLTPEEHEIVLRTFTLMDADADGYVSREELCNALRNAFGEAIGNDEEKLLRVTDYVLTVVDVNHDGKLSWAEFRRSFELGQGVLPIAVPAEETQPEAEQADAGQQPEEAQAERPQSPVAAHFDDVATEQAQQETTPQRSSAGKTVAVVADDNDPNAGSPIKNDISGVAISEQQLRREFNKYDREGSGQLDKNEFKRIYLSLEHYGLPPTEAEVTRLFSKYSKDEKMSFDEFCIVMLQRSRM